MSKTKKIIVAGVAIAVLVIAVAVSAIGIYAGDYYHAEEDAIAAMATGRSQEKYTVFDGDGEIGLVFYPGGKVEAASYAPLLSALAERGVTCVLVEMPLNLAVLDMNAWEGAVACAPTVKTWYIAGHSLGGAMATGCATSENGFAGLILLAAYPTDAVSVPVLSIWGSEDGVMDREKYAAGCEMMPNLTEYVIEGGNHAQFGSYGTQDGDGVATVAKKVQMQVTAEQIVAFVRGEK